MLTYGSLFAGIGGLDLGLDRAGMKCKWQVELNPFCRQVLEKHWPLVRRHDDVCTFPPAGDWDVDVVAGGFPCQDISASGPGGGLNGKRSGLWVEFARTVRGLRPRYVIVENSPLLTKRGLSTILSDLAACGYNARWQVLSACMFGAPHTRARMFIVAYPQSTEWGQVGPLGCDLEDEHHCLHQGWQEGSSRAGERIAEAARHWLREPDLARVAHGVPRRLDRLRGLGNAVVPAVAEYVGRQVVEMDVAAKRR